MWRPACVRQRRWTSWSFIIQCSVRTSKYMVTDYYNILIISLMRASDREGQILQSAVGLSAFFFLQRHPAVKCTKLSSSALTFHQTASWNTVCSLVWTGLCGNIHIQACNEGVEPCEMNVLIHWRGGNCALIDLQQNSWEKQANQQWNIWSVIRGNSVLSKWMNWSLKRTV